MKVTKLLKPTENIFQVSWEAWDYLVEGQNYDPASQVLLQWRCCCEVQRSQEHLKSKDSQPYALVQARQVCK